MVPNILKFKIDSQDTSLITLQSYKEIEIHTQ